MEYPQGYRVENSHIHDGAGIVDRHVPVDDYFTDMPGTCPDGESTGRYCCRTPESRRSELPGEVPDNTDREGLHSTLILEWASGRSANACSDLVGKDTLPESHVFITDTEADCELPHKE
ncbi:MAG: hypothetical protein MUC66_01900 [Methanolinea sp.]|nr:hypothetical protein [Methanolinea sp.]